MKRCQENIQCEVKKKSYGYPVFHIHQRPCLSDGLPRDSNCITDRNAMLWNVGADSIRQPEPPLSQYGKNVDTAINAIALHYDNVVVDKYCIMPDHVHMIVFIMPDETGRIVSAPTLSVIIGSMKRWVSKQIGDNM